MNAYVVHHPEVGTIVCIRPNRRQALDAINKKLRKLKKKELKWDCPLTVVDPTVKGVFII